MLSDSRHGRKKVLDALEGAHWLRFIQKGEWKDWEGADRAYMEAAELSRVPESVAGHDDNGILVSELVHRIELQSGAVMQSDHSMLKTRRLVASLQSLLALVGPQQSIYMGYAVRLGLACLQKCRKINSVVPAGVAIKQLHIAVGAGHQKDQHTATGHDALSQCYRAKYHITRQVGDLEASVAHLTTAKDMIVSLGQYPTAKMLCRLSQLHHTYYEERMQDQDFDLALQLGPAALDSQHVDDTETCECLLSLGWLYYSRALATDSVHDYNMAVDHLTRAYEISPMYDSKQASTRPLIQGLVSCLLDRCDLTDQVQDIEAALQWA